MRQELIEERKAFKKRRKTPEDQATIRMVYKLRVYDKVEMEKEYSAENYRDNNHIIPTGMQE